MVTEKNNGITHTEMMAKNINSGEQLLRVLDGLKDVSIQLTNHQLQIHLLT